MEMVEVKTAELSGAALDWAVAQAPGALSGKPWKYHALSKCYLHDDAMYSDEEHFHPSVLWECGGPLIEKYRVSIMVEIDDLAMVSAWVCRNATPQTGASPLIAACRAICAAKLGETVSVPKELLP